jgi:outer membrane protein OmpA-like peptidoglycan-associated protein
MRARQIIAPALATFLLAACAGSSQDAPERAQQAENDKIKAQEEARDARHNADKARIEAQDATRAQQEANQNARWQAQRAAQAERDAQLQAGGVTERQVDGSPPVVRSNGIVAFTSSNADLSAETKARLDDVARDLRAHPARRVLVEGYSDDTGTADGDVQLSRKRADSVARYLEKDGVSSDRIVTRGFGARRVETTDPAYRDRVLNRHVEVVIQ